MHFRFLFLFAMLMGSIFCTSAPVEGQTPTDSKKLANSLIGRWDLTVKGTNSTYPSWLEITRSGSRTLVGSFVGQVGSARPISKIEIKDGKFHFSIPPQWEAGTEDFVFEGTFENDRIQGTTTLPKGRKVDWVGVRAPSLKRTQPPVWGKPISLFNDKDLTGWKARQVNGTHGWEVKDGLLVNAKPGQDLVTEKTFTDFKLHAEFRYPKGSNSGIYLRGRYEVQIEDGYGHEPESHEIGGVYGFLTPRINASKPAGEWQSIDITLIGREVTVVLNHETIIDRQTIPGITGGALDSDEGKPGPILLQGDHGSIEFRNLILVPSETDGSTTLTAPREKK
ncbi:DUF1080 domain-containing protein [Telmatocola sphagniphila]|uniref:DUF1080 domain-containing protein n=1 Tax=Telmatocola sphagniphila TaxID=1123043 RepID=A0A8E6F076_9BACT|nr:DUF1080 domain-containing protein [Telmatocola sphagniphila]QVL34211.1 DUF1080 domain-containing protein [Telmatocola sphagniphila]